MLQRNVSGSPLVLPTLDPPMQVLPGDMIDHPDLLAGFEIADALKPITDDKGKLVMGQPEPAVPSATIDKDVSR